MRKIKEFCEIYKTVAVAAVFVSFFMVQCAPDDKDEPSPTPAANPKERFVADWTCTEVSHRDPAAQPFQIHCTNSNGDTVLLENFYALGFQNKAKAVISGDSIIIAPLNQLVGSVYVLKGKGKLVNTSKFTMQYVVDDGNPIKDTVDATFTK